MVILGIDPGTAITGYGVIRVHNNTVSWLDSGVIKTEQTSDLPSRLGRIYDGLMERMETFKPACVCVEQAFYAKNVRTTLILGHARGVAMLAAQKSGAQVEEFSPRAIKKSLVGSGSATKQQVEYMVRFMLFPPKEHAQSDAYDALAVALCGFRNLQVRKILNAKR